MQVDAVDFASVIASRLCHDLLSPVGSVNNGLELLADETDPAMRERCLELLGDSARNSANKLKFFRLAFGSGGGFGEMVDVREARTAIEGLVAGNKRLALDWLVEDAELPKAAIRVLLNLALVATEALARGGTLAVGGESHGGHAEVALKLEGSRPALDPQVARMLTDGPSEPQVAPRAAPAYLVHSLVSQGKGKVQISEPAEGVMVFGASFATE